MTAPARQLALRDGTQAALHIWEPAQAPAGTIVIAHGLGEHAGRYGQVATDLTRAGWTVRAADLRGHGRTPGRRGTIPRTESMRDDILDALTAARAERQRGPVVLLGHSMGGAFAAWAIAHEPAAADALVLSSPALRADLSIVQRLLMTTMLRLGPDVAVSNGLDANFISHDRAVVEAYTSDPLVHDRVSSRLAHAIMTAGESVRAAAPSWQVPTLLLYAGDDRLVNPLGSQEFASVAPAHTVTAQRFDGLYHEIFNETGRDLPISVLIDWLRTRVT